MAKRINLSRKNITPRSIYAFTTLQMSRLRGQEQVFLLGFVFLITAFVWLWGFNTHSFVRRDAFDYAQISAQVSSGRGLSTLLIFPRNIPYFQEKASLNQPYWPNLYRNPLLMAVNAVFQPFFGSVAVSLVVQSGFWYLASVPVLIFLAFRLANHRVALASAVFFAADPVVSLYSYSGMTETLGTFLVVAMIAVALYPASKNWHWFLVGVLAGLAYLARAQFAILLPLSMLYAWLAAPRDSRIAAVSSVLVGLLLPLVPWFARNLRLTGDATFSFTTTRNLVLGAVPGHSDLEMQLHAPVELGSVLRVYGAGIARKFFENISSDFLSPAYWANSFRGMSFLFPVFFFAALLDRDLARSPLARRFKWILLVLILATFLVISLTVYSVRYYLVFRPLILVLAFVEIDRLLQRLNGRWKIGAPVMAAILLAGLVQLGWNGMEHRSSPPPESSFDQKAYQILERKAGPQILFASDTPEKLSYVAGVRSLPLPADPQELLEINAHYLPIDYVLLSKELWTGEFGAEDEFNYHETYAAYIRFKDSPAFLEIYALEERLPNGALLYARRRK